MTDVKERADIAVQLINCAIKDDPRKAVLELAAGYLGSVAADLGTLRRKVMRTVTEAPEPAEDGSYALKDLPAVLGVSRSTLQEWRRAHPEGKTVGDAARWTKEAVEDFRAAHPGGRLPRGKGKKGPEEDKPALPADTARYILIGPGGEHHEAIGMEELRRLTGMRDAKLRYAEDSGKPVDGWVIRREE